MFNINFDFELMMDYKCCFSVLRLDGSFSCSGIFFTLT